MLPANSEKTEKTAVRGRPFVKGQSGNPSGRPKGNPEVKSIFQSHSVDAAQKMLELMNSKDEKISFAAAREILYYTQGKPVQPQAVQMSGGLDMRAQIRAVILERLNGKSEKSGN